MSVPSSAAAIVLDVDGKSTARCLGSLVDQTLPFSRIIVIDNGSATPLESRLSRTILDRVEVIRLPRNAGFTGGVNAAMRMIDSRCVALINNDVVLPIGWLATLLPLFGDSKLGAAQTILLDPVGRIDGAGIEIVRGRVQQLGAGEKEGSVDLSRFHAVSATAALYRVAALRQVAKGSEVLDARFFAYYEDVELAERLLAAGFSMRLVEKPTAMHEGSASAAILGSRALLLRVRNRYFVARLHPRVLSRRSLALEDLRRLVAHLVRLQPVSALTILRGVAAGNFVSLAR